MARTAPTRPVPAPSAATREAIRIRIAHPADAIPLQVLQRAAVRELNARDYGAAQLEAFLGEIGTLDPSLLEDGTYRVAERGGRIVGCGGWSFRDHGVGGAAQGERRLEPARDAAWMRAFFVVPAFARRGIGVRLLRAAEAAARTAGFRRAQLIATRTGEPLYLREGYRLVERVSIAASLASLPAAHMEKPDRKSVV